MFRLDGAEGYFKYCRGVEAWGEDGLFVEFPSYEKVVARMKYLRAVANSTTCKALRFVDVELNDDEVSELWKELCSSKMDLKELAFLGDWLHDRDVRRAVAPYNEVLQEGLLSVLRVHNKLEKLSVDLIGVHWPDQIKISVDWLLEITMSPTSVLTSLALSCQGPWVKALDTIVKNNKNALVDLAFESFLISDSQLIDFMGCLAKNSSLERLSLNRCRGFSSSDSIVGAALDALGESGLPEFCIDDTPLEHNAAIRAQLTRNARHRKGILKNQEKVAAKAARLFICGDPYAGKTTLLTTLSHFVAGTATDSKQRTRGIEVRALVEEGVQVSLWDMAGQAEFYAFHDHMFPHIDAQGSPAFFLYVWSAVISQDDGDGDLKSDKEFEKSFRYWLKFIASKTRQSNVARKIIIVLTRKDQVSIIHESIAPFMDSVLQDFENIVELAGVCEVDSRELKSMEKVATYIFTTAREVLRNVQVYKICSEVRDHFTSSERKDPVITWEKFESWCSKTFGIDDSGILKAIASSLNESGDIIYLSDMPFLILNTNWFCRDIMGNLIHFSLGDRSKKTMLSTNGFVTQEYLEKFFEEFFKGEKGSSPIMEGALFVQLMEALHLCCRVPNQVPPKFFIPVMLVSSSSAAERPLAWRGVAIQDLSPTFGYMGRRLECGKKDRTFLTPGLFPLIQVSFYNGFLEINADGKLGKNFISICYQAVEIIVEFCNAHGEHVIDVLVRILPEADQINSANLVHDMVVGAIVEICAQPIGDQGVQLVEGVIRRECLKEPVPAHKREDQCVLIEELKKDLTRQLQKNPKQSKFWHTWKESPYFPAEFTSIYEMLGSQESSRLVKTYEAILREVEQELGTPEEAEPSQHITRKPARLPFEEAAPSQQFRRNESGLIKGGAECSNENLKEIMVNNFRDMGAKLSRLCSTTDAMNTKMDALNATMKTIQRDLANIGTLQSTVLPQLQRRIEQLLYFEEEKELGKMPRFCLLTTEGLGVARKLVTALIKDVKSVRIELFCEDRRGPHKVEEQEGICVTTLDDGVIRNALPYVNAFLKVVTLTAKVGAHVVAGMGESIPDFSKLISFVLDTDGVLNINGIPEIVGSMEAGIRRVSSAGWEQWLVDVLKNNGGVTDGNMMKKFKLKRALYKESLQVAWLCEEHFGRSCRSFPLIVT